MFYRLKIVEIFGTGIRRIKEAYKNSISQPVFEIFDNSIKVTLPARMSDEKCLRLTSDKERKDSEMTEEYTYVCGGISPTIILEPGTEIRITDDQKEYLKQFITDLDEVLLANDVKDLLLEIDDAIKSAYDSDGNPSEESRKLKRIYDDIFVDAIVF